MSYIKRVIIIAGPNGAGKTTFSRKFIPATQSLVHFVNADLIASGLSPFAPELEAIQAGKLMLKQIDKLVAQGESFCLETTLSGRGYLHKIPMWQHLGYHVSMIFLTLPDAQTAIARVSTRVRQGGHHIPDSVIIRRFHAGLANLPLYASCVNQWAVYDNKGAEPLLLASGGTDVPTI